MIRFWEYLAALYGLAKSRWEPIEVKAKSDDTDSDEPAGPPITLALPQKYRNQDITVDGRENSQQMTLAKMFNIHERGDTSTESNSDSDDTQPDPSRIDAAFQATE